jgi:hypothetical protein
LPTDWVSSATQRDGSKRSRGRGRKHPWFKPTRLAHPHRKRHSGAIRVQRLRGRSPDEVVIPSPPPLATAYRITKAGRKARFGDRDLLVYGLTDLGKIYGFDYQRVSGWYANGMLPEPFTTRKVADKTLPLWTREQAEAICLVLNDIWRQGCTQYASWHHAHIQMMKVGGKFALKYLNDPEPTANEIRRALTGKHGVVWISGPYVKAEPKED